MNPLFLMLGVVIGMAAGYLLMSRRTRPKFLATAEYWIYLPGENMPEQSDIMSRMIRESPFPGAVGPAEGLVFSDVRLHIACVRRDKNPLLFRPDLLADVEGDPALIRSISDCQSLAKLRYVSEEPLRDKRHLTFLIYAAEAYAALGKGIVIYDVTGERLWSHTELTQMLRKDRDATRLELHVRTPWRLAPEGGNAVTVGLPKIGREELQTADMPADQRLIATAILQEAARELWSTSETPESIEVAAFDDRFRVGLPSRKGESVTIHRIQAI